MEPVSGIMGGARIALQVISNHREPVLEVYSNLRHQVGPEDITELPATAWSKPREFRYRPREVFIEFLLANVGGQRAEKIELRFEGEFELHSGLTKLHTLPIFNGLLIPQLPTAGVFRLFAIEDMDLVERDATGKPSGMRREGFSITAKYSAPWAGLNRVRRLPAHLRGRPQFEMRFEFNPLLYQSLPIPPAEYA